MTQPTQQHSMGSEAGYSLKATDAPRAVVGRGSIHMEANYGESFPTGWVWAQVRTTGKTALVCFCRPAFVWFLRSSVIIPS